VRETDAAAASIASSMAHGLDPTTILLDLWLHFQLLWASPGDEESVQLHLTNKHKFTHSNPVRWQLTQLTWLHVIRSKCP
jgi:hypothetical protein